MSRRPVPEPTVVVVSPAHDLAARKKRTGVLPAESDARRGGDARHFRRSRSISHRPVPELTVVVVPTVAVASPAHDLATRKESTGVSKAESNARRGGDARHFHRSRTISRRVVTELTVVVPSPAHDLATRKERTGVITAESNNDYPRRFGKLDPEEGDEPKQTEACRGLHRHGFVSGFPGAPTKMKVSGCRTVRCRFFRQEFRQVITFVHQRWCCETEQVGGRRSRHQEKSGRKSLPQSHLQAPGSRAARARPRRLRRSPPSVASRLAAGRLSIDPLRPRLSPPSVRPPLRVTWGGGVACHAISRVPTSFVPRHRPPPRGGHRARGGALHGGGAHGDRRVGPNEARGGTSREGARGSRRVDAARRLGERPHSARVDLGWGGCAADEANHHRT